MDKSKRWWATGIFKGNDADPAVFTRSVLITHFMGGEEIQKLLRNEEGNTSHLVKVIMTQGTYSPMNWWASRPAITTKGENPMLWGDGEGIYASTWPEERECRKCLDGIMQALEGCWLCNNKECNNEIGLYEIG